MWHTDNFFFITTFHPLHNSLFECLKVNLYRLMSIVLKKCMYSNNWVVVGSCGFVWPFFHNSMELLTKASWSSPTLCASFVILTNFWLVMMKAHREKFSHSRRISHLYILEIKANFGSGCQLDTECFQRRRNLEMDSNSMQSVSKECKNWKWVQWVRTNFQNSLRHLKKLCVRDSSIGQIHPVLR